MTAEQRWAALVETVLASERASYGSDAGPQQAFGSTSLKTNGKIFAMLMKDRCVVKLDRRRVEELVAAGEGERFDPGHGRLMKEWLSVDSIDELDDRRHSPSTASPGGDGGTCRRGCLETVVLACPRSPCVEDPHDRIPLVTGAEWQVLFDGADTTGLRGYGISTFPSASWEIRDGNLRTIPGEAVDLVTVETYTDFEFEFTWRVTPGGNSGVLYRIEESSQPSWMSGPEYQVLDDIGHPDGANPRTSAGALYGLLEPAADKALAPAGEENTGRIVVRDGHVEHWLNDRLVVAYAWRGPAILARIRESKFRDLPAFMTVADGHIVLQHHGEEVSYGRIRVRHPES